VKLEEPERRSHEAWESFVIAFGLSPLRNFGFVFSQLKSSSPTRAARKELLDV